MTTNDDALTLTEARKEILAIIARVPNSEMPSFRIDETGCIWFDNLSMGWHSSTNPERMAEMETHNLFAAEAASRELVRRGSVVADTNQERDDA